MAMALVAGLEDLDQVMRRPPEGRLDGGRGHPARELHRRPRRGPLELARPLRGPQAHGQELPPPVAQQPAARRAAGQHHREGAAADPGPALALGQPLVQDRAAPPRAHGQRDQELLAHPGAEARQAPPLRRQQRQLPPRRAPRLDASPPRARPGRRRIWRQAAPLAVQAAPATTTASAPPACYNYYGSQYHSEPASQQARWR